MEAEGLLNSIAIFEFLYFNFAFVLANKQDM